MNIMSRIIKSKKLKLSNIKNTFIAALDSNVVLVKWSESEETINNFGDALNPWLIKKISNKRIVNINKVFNFTRKPVYSCIGSVLDNCNIKNLHVWGTGFKSINSNFIRNPEKIYAVRGPLSRNNIMKQGIECPEIYGDPALLVSKYYYPRIEKKYKLGIVAHYVDKKSEEYSNLISDISDNVLIIDIEDKIQNFIDNILKCESIASSSLHGLIIADSYKIPSLYIKFSDNIIGGDFKFRDYMASVSRPYKDPIQVTDSIKIDYLLDSFQTYDIYFDSEKLLTNCPFIDN